MSDRRKQASPWLRFGGFEVHPRTGELIRQGRRVRLADKPFQVLVSLLERPGELVTREALREKLWSDDTFVDFDNNLNAAVSRLREALNDSPQGPRFIETIPRKGYRFVGPPPVEVETSVQDPRPGGRRLPALALAAAIVAVAIAASFLLLRRSEPPEAHVLPPTGRSMMAVLPFENLSDDPEQEYVADGLTEELLSRLGGVAPERLGVIARTSVRRYKKTDKTIEEIGAELGIDFAVEGSVRVQGERLRVAAQLIRVSDQTHMWTETYDRGTEDLLGIQHDIAIQVATAILHRLLLPDSEQVVDAPTANVEAFEEYLRGLHELAGNDVATSRRAVEHLERAVVLDPDVARFWAALAEARNNVWFGAETPEEARRISEQARTAASKALELDPSLAEAFVALGFSRLYHDWDARGAAEALGPPLARSPNSAQARHLAAAAFAALARHDEALAAAAEALLLDPASPASGAALGWYYLFAGRPADAEASCRRVLDSNPGNRSASECLYQALLRNGKGSEAIRIFGGRLIRDGVPRERFEGLDPEDPARAIPELERIRLEQIFAERKDDRTAPFDAAVAFTLLGETDRAFAGLDMAFERRDSRLLHLGVDPRFDNLRQDPRFELLLRRIQSAD